MTAANILVVTLKVKLALIDTEGVQSYRTSFVHKRAGRLVHWHDYGTSDAPCRDFQPEDVRYRPCNYDRVSFISWKFSNTLLFSHVDTQRVQLQQTDKNWENEESSWLTVLEGDVEIFWVKPKANGYGQTSVVVEQLVGSR